MPLMKDTRKINNNVNGNIETQLFSIFSPKNDLHLQCTGVNSIMWRIKLFFNWVRVCVRFRTIAPWSTRFVGSPRNLTIEERNRGIELEQMAEKLLTNNKRNNMARCENPA